MDGASVLFNLEINYDVNDIIGRQTNFIWKNYFECKLDFHFSVSGKFQWKEKIVGKFKKFVLVVLHFS